MAAEFAAPLPQLIAATNLGNMQRRVLRDRKKLPQWSKDRATLVGDAAHPTSPHAAYGAGMASEDDYLLGRRLAGVDPSDYAALLIHQPSRRHPARSPATELRSRRRVTASTCGC